MGSTDANCGTGSKLTESAGFPRVQFRLRSVLVVTLIASILLAWWTRPERVEVYALARFDSDLSRSGVKSTHQDLLDLMVSQPVLADALAGLSDTRLELVRKRPNAVEWLREHLDAQVIDKSGTICLSITVDTEYSDDARKIIDHVVALSCDHCVRYYNPKAVEKIVRFTLVQPASVR